jgi:N-acetylglucosamine-6-phosphate deacetylase
MRTLYYNGNIISSGKVFAGAALVENGKIKEVLTAPETLPAADKIIDLGGNFLSAGFIDTHIHGYGGFGTDANNPQDLLEMSLALEDVGVAGFCPAVYPARIDEMVKTVGAFAAVIGRERGAKIIGIHLEGPFISPDKPGSMKKEDIISVDLDKAAALFEAGRGKITSMTVAPELPGIDKLAALAGRYKILLDAGHTNATYQQMLDGADLGIRHVTHLFNAMTGISHREPGAAVAALADDDFSCAIIADGKHVHPAVAGMLRKLKPQNKVVLVTDSLTPAGFAEGRAMDRAVKLDDGLFRRKDDNVIAGSSLTMLRGVKNLMAWGFDTGSAFMAGCDNPANLLGLDIGILAPGKEARLIVLDKNFDFGLWIVDF